MTDDEPAIRVQHLSKRFELHQERRYTFKERAVRGKPKGKKDFWALRDVSFDIARGSFFGVIGHNGSGKSTALKVLAGIYRPTEGRVEVNGRLRALLELGAGFHPELTGRENIALNASILGMSTREIRSYMDEIIEFADIGDFIDSPVKVYSSGMSVRLGFAVAVKMDPEILVVDEVIAVGDEEFQRRCQDYMFNLRRRGVTIVLVTHAMALVEEMCDQAVWLDHGEVRAQGPATDVVRGYLHQVNRAEAQRKRPAAPGGGLDEARHGSGEVQVTGIEYLGEHDEPLDVVVSGRPCRVRLHYTASQQLTGANVGIMVYHETGAYLAGPPSRRDQPFDFAPGRGSYEFTMPELLLQPGTYQLSSVIAVGGSFVDYLDRPFILKVRGEGESDTGMVRLPGDWTGPRHTG